MLSVIILSVTFKPFMLSVVAPWPDLVFIKVFTAVIKSVV